MARQPHGPTWVLDTDADDYLYKSNTPGAREPRRPYLRNCANCGKPFRCAPSDKTRTCSQDCSSRHRSRKHLGKRNLWSDDSKAKARMVAARTGNLKRGTPAARENWKSGPFEMNLNAKEWVVISPCGRRYECRNLRLWCERNARMFEPHHWRNAYAGLRQVSAWMRGKTRRQVSTWRGWSLEP